MFLLLLSTVFGVVASPVLAIAPGLLYDDRRDLASSWFVGGAVNTAVLSTPWLVLFLMADEPSEGAVFAFVVERIVVAVVVSLPASVIGTTLGVVSMAAVTSNRPPRPARW